MDLEFIEDGKTIDIISIGIVAEDGKEFHAINWNCNFWRANEWVKENVLSHIPFRPLDEPKKENGLWQTRANLPNSIAGFFGCKANINFEGKIEYYLEESEEPEIWSYYGDYDWVAFCQLFGTMMDLPKGFPMYANDLKQWSKMLGSPNLPEQEESEHDALNDARWNKKVWEFLREYQENIYDFSLSRL